MNKRTRELAEQAGFQYIKDERIGWAGNYNASLPKFAELIIRECIGLVEKDIEPELDDSDYAEHWNMALRSASNEIKKHFGVE